MLKGSVMSGSASHLRRQPILHSNLAASKEVTSSLRQLNVHLRAGSASAGRTSKCGYLVGAAGQVEQCNPNRRINPLRTKMGGLGRVPLDWGTRNGWLSYPGAAEVPASGRSIGNGRKWPKAVASVCQSPFRNMVPDRTRMARVQLTILQVPPI